MTHRIASIFIVYKLERRHNNSHIHTHTRATHSHANHIDMYWVVQRWVCPLTTFQPPILRLTGLSVKYRRKCAHAHIHTDNSMLFFSHFILRRSICRMGFRQWWIYTEAKRIAKQFTVLQCYRQKKKVSAQRWFGFSWFFQRIFDRKKESDRNLRERKYI